MQAILITNDAKEADEILDLIAESEDAKYLGSYVRICTIDDVGIQYEIHTEINLKRREDGNTKTTQ